MGGVRHARFIRSGSSRWVQYVLAGVLVVVLALLVVPQLQGVSISRSSEIESLRAEVAVLRQALKGLQHATTPSTRMPAAAVKSSKASIMLLNDAPLCHIDSQAAGWAADLRSGQAQLDRLRREHNEAQQRFCQELAAGNANPGGTPGNDTYMRVPDVRAVGNASLSFPMWVHKVNDIVSNAIAAHGIWEHTDTSAVLQHLHAWKQANAGDSTGPILLDIGANLGWYSLQAAAMGFSVLSFEPMTSNLGALRRTLCESPELATNIALIPKGLSNEPRKCQMYVDKVNMGDGVLVCEGSVFEAHKRNNNYALVGEFDLATLDSLFGNTMDALAGHVEVVKIDVEGFEPQVFAGGRTFISRVKPRYIMAEVNNFNGAASPEIVQRILHMYNNLGYAVHSSNFQGPTLLPKDYSSLAQSMFGPGAVVNIYMDRLKPCSEL